MLFPFINANSFYQEHYHYFSTNLYHIFLFLKSEFVFCFVDLVIKSLCWYLEYYCGIKCFAGNNWHDMINEDLLLPTPGVFGYWKHGIWIKLLYFPAIELFIKLVWETDQLYPSLKPALTKRFGDEIRRICFVFCSSKCNSFCERTFR